MVLGGRIILLGMSHHHMDKDPGPGLSWTKNMDGISADTSCIVLLGNTAPQAPVSSPGIVLSRTKELEEFAAWAALRLEGAASESFVRLYAEQCSD